MGALDFLIERLIEYESEEAIVWRGRPYSYGELHQELRSWQAFFESRGLPRGASVSLEADFSPRSVSLLLALIDHDCIVTPLTSSVDAQKAEFRDVAEVEYRLDLTTESSVQFIETGVRIRHPILRGLQETRHPALVLFSSGSTGKSKAAVHNFVPLLEKFEVRRHRRRMLGFLLFDHIGGVNTLLYCLSNGGCLVTTEDRAPDVIARIIQDFKVEVLPTSPTFLNLLLLSQAWQKYDLSSLGLVTYGTEPMPQVTLKAIAKALPHVKLQQTYGLSEVGILRSVSEANDSLWMRVGGEGYETRVVDGLLEIRARSAMLGYLNAPSPFKEDGWFQTGDLVEQKGEFIRVLARESDLINVGGEKVYPSEVEGPRRRTSPRRMSWPCGRRPAWA